MAWNKKTINIPISFLSSEEIYALLGDIDSDYDEEIDNLMNDSDTEFTDRTVIEKSESDISETRFWIWGWCSIQQSGGKKNVVWKLNKRVENPALKKCSLML